MSKIAVDSTHDALIIVDVQNDFCPGGALAVPQGDEVIPPINRLLKQRWLSVAAGPLAFGPAAARLVTVFGASFNTDEVISRAHTLLKVIDAELANTPFLTGSTPTIADIANYSYIAHAPEGNVSLEPYANVRNWLARIEALPRFVPMPRTVIGLQTHA